MLCILHTTWPSTNFFVQADSLRQARRVRKPIKALNPLSLYALCVVSRLSVSRSASPLLHPMAEGGGVVLDRTPHPSSEFCFPFPLFRTLHVIVALPRTQVGTFVGPGETSRPGAIHLCPKVERAKKSPRFTMQIEMVTPTT